MTHSAACNTDTNQTFNISFIEKNIDDENIMYLHNKSIIVTSPEETLSTTKVSLAELLTEKLNSVGRKNLAERTIEKKFITYKEFRSLIHQINKPRTLQTLLANRYLQWSIHYESFPDFVKDDMRKNNILALPSNICDLPHTISSSTFDTNSLVLLKYIATQCMEIDYNSRFEVLEEEYKYCMQQLLMHSFCVANKKFPGTIKYITNLECIRTAWEQQDPEAWNRLTQPTTTHAGVSFSSETSLSDKLHKSQVLDSNASSSRQEAETTNKETINNSPHEPLITPSQSTIPEKITESQLWMLDKEQGEDAPKPKLGAKRKSKKSRKKTKHSSYPKDYLEPPQIFLASPQKTITKATTSLPENNSSETSLTFQEEKLKKTLPPLLLENNSNKALLASPQEARPKERTTQNNASETSLAFQEERSKDTLPPLLLENNYNEASLASSQGVRPKEKTLLEYQKAKSNTHGCTICKNLEIDSSEKFSMSVIFFYQEITNSIMKKEAVVLDYLNNPKSKKKLDKVKNVLNKGPWHTERYFDLLEKVYEVDKLEYFANKLNFFIKNSHFHGGYPPTDISTGKAYLKTPRKLIGFGINYYYILADNVTPSEAMDACMTHLWFINQETHVLLSYKKALRDYWNDDRLFDHYFSKHIPNSDVFSIISFLAPMNIKNKCRILQFLKSTSLDQVDTDTQFEAGSLYTFENHPCYHDKHINGDYKFILSFCASVKPIPLFITSCSSKKLTIDEIQNTLVEKYNKKPLNDKFMPLEDWDILLAYCRYQFIPKPIISTITREHLLNEQKKISLRKYSYQKFSISVKFELIKDIKSHHLKYMEKIKNKEDEALKQKNKYRDERKVCQPLIISSQPNFTSKTTIIKTQTKPEPSQIDILNKYINNFNTDFRRHKKYLTSTSEIKAKEAFYKLEVFFNKLKTDNINIDTKTQSHYNDAVKKMENI